ncbi:hypothetical protein MRB53_035872 [Persea americana]|uniref:Uncharacterized protein n=1 Tax=Persea americana TaxID=3435 RepID=A0ACC2K5Z2_PERAE|nr:hypothetical protein MRB53_035872 [Persea americana]
MEGGEHALPPIPMPISTPVGPLPTTNSHLNLLPPASVIRLSSGLPNSIQKQLQTKRGEEEKKKKKKKQKKRGLVGSKRRRLCGRKKAVVFLFYCLRFHVLLLLLHFSHLTFPYPWFNQCTEFLLVRD